METKIFVCPNCHKTLEVETDRTRIFCGYCGTPINLAKKDIAFQETRFITPQGQVVGYAEVPQGWRIGAELQNKQVDDLTPFYTTMLATNRENTMQVGSHSGENYYTHRRTTILSQFAGQKHVEYLEPDDYLLDVARRLCGVDVALAKTDTLRTRYLANIDNEAGKIIARFEERGNIVLPSVQLHLKLTNAMFDSRMIEATFIDNREEMAVFIGGDLFGLEYYDASPTASLGRGITGGIGNIFSKAKEAMEENNEQIDFGWFMRGGIVGSMMRQRNKQDHAPVQKQEKKQGTAPFGHAHEYGLPVDTINWGSKRIYYAIGPLSQEDALEQAFRKMAETYCLDQSLVSYLEQYHMQVRQSEMSTLNNATNYAYQSHMMNMQRLNQVSKTLSQSNDIVMQGYQNRQEAYDRMSQKRSEAIRGVNTYTTSDGRSVEHSVSSDHVYETKYGDTVGVSGNAIDDSVATDLGWKEIFKKK